MRNGYHGQIIGSSDNSGNNHAYELLYLGSGTYGAYLDFSSVGSASGLGGGTCISQAGLELSGNDSADYLAYQHADEFDDNPLQWESSGGTWNSGWSLSETWQDHPCGVNGYTTPDCLNRWWVNNSNNDFANDKP